MYYRMSGVLYHRVIHGLGLFICLEALYRGNACGVTWVFDQSENTRSILFHIALASSERLIFKVEILASISQPSTLVLALHSVLIKKRSRLAVGSPSLWQIFTVYKHRVWIYVIKKKVINPIYWPSTAYYRK